MTIFRIMAGLLAAAFLAAMYYVFSGDQEARIQTNWEVRPDSRDANIVIFSWVGSIDPSIASELSKKFKNWKDKSSRIRIELDSPGGSVAEGERVIQVINQMKKTHTVWTYVGSDSDCLSMCVPIFLQGSMRIAGPTSTWLFHDASAADIYTGAEIVMYAHERNQANFEFFIRYIERSDINPRWRDNLRAELRRGDVWKSGQELKNERSNIVTVLE